MNNTDNIKNFEKIKNYLNNFGYIMGKELLRGFLFFEKK